MLPAIFGLAGHALSERERSFFRAVQPVGFILFARNIQSRRQLAALTASLRDSVGRDDVPILIDQEGGRVARLQPPQWSAFPQAQRFADLWQHDPTAAVRAAKLNYEALGLDLAEVGINVDCAPVLDVPQPGAHDVIGDRAFGTDPKVVAELGQAALVGLARAGVVGVIKHIPGHGRSLADSHHDLPVVKASVTDLEVDLAPFRALAGAPMAMTAHIVYEAWDSEQCATLSSTVIENIVRQQIGFDGLLMSDDLDMKALSGKVPELACAAIDAGCDVALNCWGKMADMEAMAECLPEASAGCRQRLTDAMVGAQPLGEADNVLARQRDLIAERDELLASANAGVSR